MSLTMVSHSVPGEIAIESFQVAQIIDAEVQSTHRSIRFRGASCDSRQVQPGNLFVALRGARTDGHRYLAEAERRGASVLLVERDHPLLARGKLTATQIRVADPLDALQRLARWHRDRLDIPFVAVTGSNGKTTTKDMIAAMLGARYAVFKTPGNLNSGIGVPLALLDLAAAHEIAVCELGMSARGEIDLLGAMVRPRYAVFTNIAPAHLDTLGTLADVAAAKFELLAHLPHDGVAFLCAEDPILRAKAEELGPRSRTFGFSADADLRAHDVRPSADGLRFSLEGGEDVFLPLFGRHNVCNALAALLVARTLGVDTLAAVAALATLAPAPHRSRIESLGSLVIIDDVYNANPKATISALQSLAEFPLTGRRVAVLGEMLELGRASESLHREVGEQAAALALDQLVTVGPKASAIGQAAAAAGMSAACIRHFEDAQACAEAVAAWCEPHDTVLLKGSRGVALETVLDRLHQVFANRDKEEP
jgi:UDP-N-acetylmuramoyl-tripeptide--D-alanyl-D-alanine ligase